MQRTFATLSVVFSLLFASFDLAPSQPAKLQHIRDIEKVLDLYHQSLKHDNEGIVESAIFCLLTAKVFYPQEDYDKVTEELTRLAFLGATPVIRYKSFVAANYLQHPEWFDGSIAEIHRAHANPAQSDQLFATLLTRMESRR